MCECERAAAAVINAASGVARDRAVREVSIPLWLEMPRGELPATVQSVRASVPKLIMLPPLPPPSARPLRMLRLERLTLTPEPMRKIRKAGSVLLRWMTIPVSGPLTTSRFSITSVPPPAPGLASVIAPVRPGAKLISVACGSLIASRMVHCAALQMPSPGSARLLTTLCPAVWVWTGPPGSAGAVGGWFSPQAASTRSGNRTGSRRGW